MNTSGIVRKIDELGRIVIPKEIRQSLGIGEKDRLEISADQKNIVLKKIHDRCTFCDGAKALVFFKDRMVCEDCLIQLNDFSI